jgi:hypothetical protein
VNCFLLRGADTQVAGSAGYNLGIATSDKDLFGVYLADEKGVL